MSDEQEAQPEPGGEFQGVAHGTVTMPDEQAQDAPDEGAQDEPEEGPDDA